MKALKWIALGAGALVLIVAAVVGYIAATFDPNDYRGKLFYEGAGCLECNGTGFDGRAAISELLDLSDRIRGMILDRRPASEIKKAAKEEGMLFLRESALRKVMTGQTTLREINKVTFVE